MGSPRASKWEQFLFGKPWLIQNTLQDVMKNVLKPLRRENLEHAKGKMWAIEDLAREEEIMQENMVWLSCT